MKTYTWEDFYDRFFDWAESTQVRNLSGLEALGPVDEVAEVIIELTHTERAATRLLRRAVEAKCEFKGEDVFEFYCLLDDEKLVYEAFRNSVNRFTEKDIELFYGDIDDDMLIEICEKANLPLPKEMLEEEEDFEEPEEPAEEYVEEFIEEDIEEYEDSDEYERPRKKGFFGLLGSILASGGSNNNGMKKHRNRSCDGDCAHCPPHFGYRYGRWYYGRDHHHGCEFGGNRCSGSMD